jgi:hypothetical protein
MGDPAFVVNEYHDALVHEKDDPYRFHIGN